jgi:sphinganine C4-monooxygenase
MTSEVAWANMDFPEYFSWVTKNRIHLGEWSLIMSYTPVIVYWVICLVYELLDYLKLPATEKHRIQRINPGRPTSVSKKDIAIRVLLQHTFQILTTVGLAYADPDVCVSKHSSGAVRFFIDLAATMFVMDTWQYFIHRMMHDSTFLYKHIHSTHHQLYIPSAMGALYNHPLEGLLLDTLGGLVCLLVTGMCCEHATIIFSIATAKTVFDHCGYRYPINPVHDLLPNSAAYHDVHHELKGTKKNFSQPFFTWWDRALGTYADPVLWHVVPPVAAGAELKKTS